MTARRAGQRFRRITLGALLLGLLACPAAQAITLGPTTFVPDGTLICSTACTAYNHAAPLGVQLKAPAAGVVTRWRTNASGTVTLRVVRQSGATTSYSGVSTGPSGAGAGTTNTVTFTAQLPIAANDQIGMDVVAGSLSGELSGSATGWTALAAPPLANGGAAQAPNTTNGNRFWNINADLEPDADADVFGDESQDRCVGTAGSDRGCPPGVLDPKVVQVVQVVQSVNPAGGPAVLDLAGAKLSRDRKTLSFGVSCPAQRTRRCQGTASAETAGKVSLARSAARRAVVKLGSVGFNIGAGQVRTVRVKVSSTARQKLKRLRSLRLKLIVTESSSGNKTL